MSSNNTKLNEASVGSKLIIGRRTPSSKITKSLRDNDVTALPCLSTTPTFNCTNDVSVVMTSSGCWAETLAATINSPVNDRIRVVRRARFKAEAGTEDGFIPSLTCQKIVLLG